MNLSLAFTTPIMKFVCKIVKLRAKVGPTYWNEFISPYPSRNNKRTTKGQIHSRMNMFNIIAQIRGFDVYLSKKLFLNEEQPQDLPSPTLSLSLEGDSTNTKGASLNVKIGYLPQE